LFRTMRGTDDPQLRAEIRDHLIQRHEGLVRHVVKDYVSSGESYDDLYGVGMLGLINAVDRFDPARGTRFATFAVPTIRGEIRRYFRDKTWGVRVPRRIQELSLKAREAVEAFTQDQGRAPTYEELAQKLGVSEEDAMEALEVSRQYDLASFEQPSVDGDDEAMAESDRIGVEDPAIEEIGDRDAIARALTKLPPRERAVIVLRYFGGLSQQEVGRRLNVSQMHVSRLQHRALKKLKSLLGTE
ncbi:MAG: SigB/SigF/SigG family RNA polymerase sigma factor, partial [Armatimonadetes bacterium]|nr:SigB/SigF/SigG family RNA polymerase sigma factor [Armatimonadota bacterium]